jgi:hypothetical protein
MHANPYLVVVMSKNGNIYADLKKAESKALRLNSNQ